jgi:2-phosphoxylose phosphatase
MPCQIDSLVPRYSCPRADSIRTEYQSVPAWTDHLAANEDLKNRLDAALGTEGLSSWATWCEWLFLYLRQAWSGL